MRTHSLRCASLFAVLLIASSSFALNCGEVFGIFEAARVQMVSLLPFHASLSQKQMKIFSIFEYGSPRTDTYHLDVENSLGSTKVSEAQRQHLKPELELRNIWDEKLQASISSMDQFLATQQALETEGFWVIFTPSDDHAEYKSGHLNAVVNHWLFSRKTDHDGDRAIESNDLSQEGARNRFRSILEHNRFAVAQFFAVTPQTRELYSKFLHDRVWFYRTGDPNFQMRYTGLPLGRHKDRCGENCVTFINPWTNATWIKRRPEVMSIARELGPMDISEIPSRQLFMNTKSPAYRGSIIISANPELARSQLLQDGWREDDFGAQCLFADPAKRIE